jgi:hypothetical protein
MRRMVELRGEDHSWKAMFGFMLVGAVGVVITAYVVAYILFMILAAMMLPTIGTS